MLVLRNKYLRIVFGLSFFILVLTAIIAYFGFARKTTPLIIHFDLFKGIDFLGNRANIVEILVIALIIYFLNFFLAEFIFKRQQFFSFVLGFATLAISVIIFIALRTIMLVN